MFSKTYKNLKVRKSYFETCGLKHLVDHIFQYYLGKKNNKLLVGGRI